MTLKRSSGRSVRGEKRGVAKVFLIANLIVWGVIGGWYLFQAPERKEEVSRLVGNWVEGRKNVTAFEVAWDLWQIYGSDDFVAGGRGTVSGNRSEMQTLVYGGALPGSQRKVVRVLANEGYVVGYSEALGNPLWAAYRSFDVKSLDAPKRPENFRVDERTVARVEPGDYSRSGYDRGHLAPNYAIATRYGRVAQEETFLMSNITPQKHALNAGAWRRLEERIATSYAARFGEVWVMAGPVFGAKLERLARKVAVPEAFFMIVVDESEGRVRAQAFLFPQEAEEGDELGKYLVSIDEIEARTGLDFLSVLPDEAEAALEAKRVTRVW
ncbi:endonuclease [Nibricoccus aquaticus]|uniref:Endonuclease n=1 Tax=Nibricoccus aquaticus TaxID=2576891 RepID=A0A290QGT6_9BACT|nr:DNA/RNA non-specific endonuclease [Nibricoccus aquaticus]ATC64548.1 endonuclease [Nibricoccus aquaticus]